MVSPSTDKAPSIVELTPETYQQDVSSDSIDLESGAKSSKMNQLCNHTSILPISMKLHQATLHPS